MQPSLSLPAAASRPSRARSIALVRALVRRTRDALPEGRAIAEEVWQRRHTGMLWILWLHVPVIVAYAVIQGEGLRHGLFEGITVAAPACAAQWGPKHRRFLSVSATLGLVMSSAVLVHLSGGLIELHFHYFVTLAAVSLYHDWAPFLTAIGFVAVQHGAMGVLDPTSVYNHASALEHPWRWAGIHASFVLAASAVSLVRWKSSEVEALKDPLTWLPNRALFGDRLRQALTRREEVGHAVAVMFLDVDDFKAINDTAGHAAGDKLLIVVADRLRAVVRPVDTVARLGGDEFAVVLEGVESPASAEDVARRILSALHSPLVFEGRQLSVTASIGIAVQADHESEADLVRNADIAMYVAKRNGKGRYATFEPSMHRAVLERAQLAEELERALIQRELRLLYQPVKNLEEDSIAGFEALLRWEHPRLGMLTPPQFISIAEETGLIVPIGRWVLATAAAQAKAWETMGPATPRWMSVNVSVRQLSSESFADDVAAVVRGAGLAPEQLLLEITESAMVGEDEAMLARLNELRALGVRLALDDFGTGYSSLGYLRRLPIDVLKIDKTFVDGTDQGAEEAALARAILKIAESIGLECVAEGVEREEQARQLRAAGCMLAQGFFFSRPVEPERIEAMLTWTPQAPEARGTILVVSADAVVRDLVGRKLRRAGFATLLTPDGAAALLAIRREHIDLLVLDLPLADMHPIELGTRIKNREDTSALPIMVLTEPAATADPAVTAAARVADAHVSKPLRDDELIQRVQALLDVAMTA